MGLFDKKTVISAVRRLVLWETGNWIMVICVRSVQENFHRGSRRGVIAP